jgi:hypothetical protein
MVRTGLNTGVARQVILFLIFLGIIFLAFNFRLIQKRNTITHCSSSQISEIHFKGSSKPFAVLESPDKTRWNLHYDSVTTHAHLLAVDGIRGQLCRLTYVESFEKTEGTPPQEFGFETSKEIVEMVLDHQLQVLTFGNLAPAGTEYYVSFSGKPNLVFLVPNKLKKLIMLDLMEFHPRFVFDQPWIQSVHITYQDGEWNLSRPNANAPWTATDPTLSPQDLDEVGQALKAIYFTQFFPGVGEERLADFGFYLPDLELRLSGESQAAQMVQIVHFNQRYYLKRDILGETYVLILDFSSTQNLVNRLERIFLRKSSLGNG